VRNVTRNGDPYALNQLGSDYKPPRTRAIADADVNKYVLTPGD